MLFIDKNSIFSARNRRAFLILTLFFCLALFSSCKKEDAGKKEPEKKSEKINETVEKGPAKVSLDADKKEITIAEQVNLSISIDIDEEYEVELPFGDKLEQFGIVDYHTTQPELKGDKRKLIKRTYILEPFLSGDYPIKPMKIIFFKKGDKEKHYIETPEVTIKVTSLLPQDIKDLRLNDIIPPLPYPRSYMVWIWGGAGAGLLILLAVGVYFYRKRFMRVDAIEIRLKAHEMAYNELKALVDENLIEKGDIKVFYLRLSAIVRRYIENRFGLRAPEQTTEEFLKGLESAQDFLAEYKSLLNNFLRHCDLVKFARFEPETKDIQGSFDSCKAFIQGTEEQD